jgi:methylmalonyl-CoA mutase N-terminal domain/subunit
VDAFAPRLSFFFNVHNQFLEEVAKFRAARRIWATIMKERFQAKKPASLRLRFHTQTAGCTLTAQQPENNVIRVTLQAMAAVLGGTQSLHTNSLDEAIGLPSDEAVRIALRTQQIILEESGAADSIDPLGGSYQVESLTDQIENRALALIKSIDDMGGMVEAIEADFPQQEIERSSYDYQKSIEDRSLKVVGVNSYIDEEEKPKDPFRLDPALEQGQIGRLQERKAERDGAAVAASLSELKSAAAGQDNLVPPILAAVRHTATIGEICETLAQVFGRYNDGRTVS